MIKKLLINAILIYVGAGIISSLLGDIFELMPYISVAICIVAPILGCVAIKIGSQKKVIKKPKFNLSKIKFNISLNIILIFIIGLYLSEINFISIIFCSIKYSIITIFVTCILWNTISLLFTKKLPTYSECWKAFI